MASLLKIQQWQGSISSDQRDQEPALVASVFSACNELFSVEIASLRNQPAVQNQTIQSIERSHDLLKLWANENGVVDGLFDASLDSSPRARSLTLQALQSICRLLSRNLPSHIPFEGPSPLAQKVTAAAQWAEKLRHMQKRDDAYESDLDSDLDSDDSSSSSPTDGDSELEETAKDLATDTYGLVRLGSQFGKPNHVALVSQEAALSPERVTDWNPSHHFTERIQSRYPQCNISLAQRLGRANWNRWVRRKEVIDLNAHNQGETPRTRDSALGSSILTATMQPPPSTYAETVQTYFGGEGDPVKIPRLSKEAKMGKPFSCVGCGKSVVFTQTRAWKTHLLLDLQPYVCPVDGCPHDSVAFINQGQWIVHILQTHESWNTQRSKICPVCEEQVNGTKMTFIKHMSRHMEEFSLAIIPFADSDEDNPNILNKSSTSWAKVSTTTDSESPDTRALSRKDEDGDIFSTETSTSPKKHTCIFCGQTYSGEGSSTLVEHMVKNHPENKLIIKLIQEGLANPPQSSNQNDAGALPSGKDNSLLATHQCPYCHEAFTKSDHLRTHLEENHPESDIPDDMGVSFVAEAMRPPPPPPPPRQYAPHGTYSAFPRSTIPEDGDDWDKTMDLTEHRRVQNRIAQRKYREKLKRRLEDLDRRAGESSSPASGPQTPATPKLMFTPPMHPEDETLFGNHATMHALDRRAGESSSPALEPQTPATPKLMFTPPMHPEDETLFGNHATMHAGFEGQAGSKEERKDKEAEAAREAEARVSADVLAKMVWLGYGRAEEERKNKEAEAAAAAEAKAERELAATIKAKLEAAKAAAEAKAKEDAEKT